MLDALGSKSEECILRKEPEKQGKSEGLPSHELMVK